VVTVTASGVELRGFVIERGGRALENEDSGILLRAGGATIEDNELRDVLYGIYFFNSGDNTLRRNRIRGRRELELGGRGSGLHLWNSPRNRIEENTISEMRDGLYIQSSPGNLIRGNRVTELRYGLHYMFSDANTFEDNLFTRNVAGAAIMYSSRIELRRNAFVRNRGASSFGILFQDCRSCVAQGNFILDNATGVFLEAVRDTEFLDNVIAGNDVALEIFASSEGNTFTGNNFVSNLSPLQVVGRRTSTRWSRAGRGNYWSDYDGYDLDGDGIGDRPHRIQNLFECMEGNYPRLRLYLESPAAQALAFAECAFPVLQASSEVDPAPLMRPAPLRWRGDAEGRSARPALFGGLSAAALGLAAGVVWMGRRR
jgi:nitrous oxidase accessory protein